MSKKNVDGLLMEQGRIHPPKVRGAMEAWIDHKEGHNWNGERGTIPVDVQRGLPYEAFLDFRSFLNDRIEEDFFQYFDTEVGQDDIQQIFNKYWKNNEELQDRFKSIAYYTHDASILINVKAAEEQGGIITLLDEYGKHKLAKISYEGKQSVEFETTSDEDDEEEEHKDQSSFGASRFPELFEIDVVDESGNVNDSKLRGLVIAFAKDVDEIRGEDRGYDIVWAQRAFLHWGNDKFEDEWIDFVSSKCSNLEIYDAVEWVSDNRDDVVEMLEKKYVGGYDLEMGNPGTDDVSKAFLDTEVPGWDEDDEDEEPDTSDSKWNKFEEKSKEKERETEETQDREDEGEEESKWTKFEKQSKEKLDNNDGQLDEGGQDSDSDDSDSVGDRDDGSVDDPSDIGSWGDAHGTVDEVHKPSRTRAGSESKDKETTQQSKSKDVTTSKTTTVEADVECEDFGRPHEIQWPDVEPIDEFERNRVYEGNTFEWALKLPENSIDTLVTSPPYYALRDYDIDEAFPISGDFTCDHEWENEFCTKCGSFLGQLGHEPDPATFIEHIVDLMERYKRVLKPTGSLWLNIGDTYAGKKIDGRVKANNKSRMMIPERVYRRMVQTGWHLRDYVIWAKKVWMPDDDLRGNGKPFASSNRLADQWEPMVRFTPQADHYSDVDSNRLQPPSFDGDLGSEGIEGKFRKGEDTQRGKTYNELGTNPPDIWLINSDGYDGDHRAVFPEELPKRCINITTPDRVCEQCGKPYDKEVHVEDGKVLSAGGDYATYEPTCNCDADHQPGVAFDPFLGSGTTAVAAANNGYDWAGVELSDKYIELARSRIPKGRQVGIDQW